MAKRTVRKPRITRRSKGKPGRHERIHIPQTPERPLKIASKDVVRWESVQDDAWWFTEHRRGPHRPWVGEDPYEARAVPKTQVRGTLPERIFYKALVDVVHQKVGIDFDFQSSLQGGRMQLGGIVADFLFYWKKFVFQVQGPTHTQYLREAKDREQRGALEEMGYKVFFVALETIFSEYLLEDFLRKTFGFYSGYGSGIGIYGGESPEKAAPDYWAMIEERLTWIEGWMVNYA